MNNKKRERYINIRVLSLYSAEISFRVKSVMAFGDISDYWRKVTISLNSSEIILDFSEFNYTSLVSWTIAHMFSNLSMLNTWQNKKSTLNGLNNISNYILQQYYRITL